MSAPRVPLLAVGLVLLALLVAFVIATLAWTGDRNGTRDQELRTQCTAAGGVWVGGSCVWSNNSSSQDPF